MIEVNLLNQVIIAQWLAQGLATGVVQGSYPGEGEKYSFGIKRNLNCGMVYSIHVQHLVQFEHIHP